MKNVFWNMGIAAYNKPGAHFRGKRKEPVARIVSVDKKALHVDFKRNVQVDRSLHNFAHMLLEYFIRTDIINQIWMSKIAIVACRHALDSQVYIINKLCYSIRIWGRKTAAVLRDAVRELRFPYPLFHLREKERGKSA